MSEEALQIAVKTREVKGKEEKERYKHLNAEFQRITRRDKKAIFSNQCTEREATTEGESLEISSRPGANCGSDHELLIAKSILKLKKVGKTTRTLRYDLNQIPYNYTVKVTNRFKGLDLIDRVPEKLWAKVHDIVQKSVIKTIPKKKNAKKENDCLRRL